MGRRTTTRCGGSALASSAQRSTEVTGMDFFDDVDIAVLLRRTRRRSGECVDAHGRSKCRTTGDGTRRDDDASVPGSIGVVPGSPGVTPGSIGVVSGSRTYEI